MVSKEWPKKELGSLLSMEIDEGRTKVLPLMVGDRIDDLLRELPLLGSKKYLRWNGDAQEIARAFRERAGASPGDEQPSAKVEEPEITTARRPDIRVITKFGISMGGGVGRQSTLGVAVQNHSPATFFYKSLHFRLTANKTVWLERDLLGTAVLESREILPGASLEFTFKFSELIEGAEGEKLLGATVTDAIDREFESTEDQMETALANRLSWEQRSR
jgi:hypothetical protein